MSEAAHSAWPHEAPIELLAKADAHIELTALAYDAVFGTFCGDLMRDLWRDIRPEPTCDCPMDPYHRWNCALTPIWAQTIRDLDTNPWTVVRDAMPLWSPPGGNLATLVFGTDA